MNNETFGVIADDFTGAMDTGVQFAQHGLRTRICLDGRVSPDDPVVVLTTDSRELDAGTARERVAGAVRKLAGRRLYKKVDSTLRGHVGVETRAALQAAGLPKAVVCPAVPAAGRVILGGQMLIDGIPLHQTSFASDPGWPATSADVVARIGEGGVSIPLEVVRGRRERYSQAVWEAVGQMVVPDCIIEEDLRRTGEVLLDPGLLACGALGLAAAWLQAMGYQKVDRDPFPLPGGAFLAVCGSANPAARALAADLAHLVNAYQVNVCAGDESAAGASVTALRAGSPVMLLLDLSKPKESNGAALLSSTAADICERAAPQGLFLFGGETARRVLHSVGVESVWAEREITPGMAYGHLEGGSCAGKWVITQSGGLSRVDFFAHPE